MVGMIWQVNPHFVIFQDIQFEMKGSEKVSLWLCFSKNCSEYVTLSLNHDGDKMTFWKQNENYEEKVASSQQLMTTNVFKSYSLRYLQI